MSLTPALPAPGYPSSNSRTQADMKTYFEDTLASQSAQAEYGDFLQDCILDGFASYTNTGLSATLGAGTIITQGNRISVASGDARLTNTYPASQDTYLDISPDAPGGVGTVAGNFHYSSVANNSTAPAVYANSLRVAKIVTSGSAVTGVTWLAPYNFTLVQPLALASGEILVGNSSGDAAPVAMSGDATLSDSGVMTLDTVNTSPGTYTNATVTVNGKGLITSASNGSSGNGTVTTTGTPASGNLAEFSGSTSITNGNLSGDVTTSGTLATTISSGAVTNPKMANMNAHTYKGNNTGSAGSPADITNTQLTADLNLATASLQGLIPALNDAQIVVGKTGSNVQAVSVSGDGTLSDTGALTVTKTNGTAFGGLATLAPGTQGNIPYSNGTNWTTSEVLGSSWTGTGVALGATATASGTGSIAIGGGTGSANSASATAIGAIAIGARTLSGDDGASASSSYSLALVTGSVALESNAIAIGYNATASGGTSSDIAIGSSAYASGGYGVALGETAHSTGLQSVALGYNSQDGGASDVVSVGNATLQRKIINAAPGAVATDVATITNILATNLSVYSLYGGL